MYKKLEEELISKVDTSKKQKDGFTAIDGVYMHTSNDNCEYLKEFMKESVAKHPMFSPNKMSYDHAGVSAVYPSTNRLNRLKFMYLLTLLVDKNDKNMYALTVINDMSAIVMVNPCKIDDLSIKINVIDENGDTKKMEDEAKKAEDQAKLDAEETAKKEQAQADEAKKAEEQAKLDAVEAEETAKKEQAQADEAKKAEDQAKLDAVEAEETAKKEQAQADQAKDSADSKSKNKKVVPAKK